MRSRFWQAEEEFGLGHVYLEVVVDESKGSAHSNGSWGERRGGGAEGCPRGTRQGQGTRRLDSVCLLFVFGVGLVHHELEWGRLPEISKDAPLVSAFQTGKIRSWHL